MIEIGVHIGAYAGFESTSGLEDKHTYYSVLLARFLVKLIKNSVVKYYQNEVFDYFGEVLHDVITIFDYSTNKYVLIDFADGPSFSVENISDKNMIASYASMYKDGIPKILNPAHLSKYNPFFFFDQYPNKTKNHRKIVKSIRKDKKNLIPKMVFHGTIGDESDSRYVNYRDGQPVRKIVRVLQENYPDLIDVFSREEKLDREDWWETTSKYILTLTLPGHPWCFREHECWSLGIATIANTYTSPLPYPLIGDVHYVDCNTSGKDRMDVELDPEHASSLIANRFEEVKTNYRLVTSIEKNSMIRYNTYNHPKSAALYLKSELKRLKFLK